MWFTVQIKFNEPQMINRSNQLWRQHIRALLRTDLLWLILKWLYPVLNMKLLKKQVHFALHSNSAVSTLTFPVTQTIMAKRIREKKSLIADNAVMSVPDVVVKHLTNLTTLLCWYLKVKETKKSHHFELIKASTWINGVLWLCTSTIVHLFHDYRETRIELI